MSERDAAIEPSPMIEVFKRDVDRTLLLERAAGRPKDLNVLGELEALLEERGRT